MRTLVISDLHLGARTGRDVLSRRVAVEALVEVVQGCDRLVLLGDAIELRHGPVRVAFATAEKVFKEIGTALRPQAEVALVPGNHDHLLAAAALERRAREGATDPLGLQTELDWTAHEPLAEVASWLGPAAVRSFYPGLWLRDDVYATHGHYGDRHTTVPMFERLGAGLMARIVGEPAGGPRRAEDYEATLAPIYAWLHAIAQAGGPELGRSSHGASAQAWRALSQRGRARSHRQRLLTAGFPVLVAALNRARIGPLRADVSGAELRRSALRAFAEVLERLDVRARHVIFGHTHRAGPLGGDDAGEWTASAGVRMLNTGCWVLEPEFLGDDPARSPYRPGFCAVLDDEGPPRLMNVLDGCGDQLPVGADRAPATDLNWPAPA